MLHALHVALTWLQIISPWLVASFIPSLIVGLTPYPKADGIVQGLKIALNFLSILSHSDSPGTFKPPMTMSKEPPVIGAELAGAQP